MKGEFCPRCQKVHRLPDCIAPRPPKCTVKEKTPEEKKAARKSELLKCNTAASMLAIHGFLTDGERLKVHRRLKREMDKVNVAVSTPPNSARI